MITKKTFIIEIKKENKEKYLERGRRLQKCICDNQFYQIYSRKLF